MHLVGFIIRNLSRCTITWTSKSLTFFSWVHFDDYFNKLIPTRTRQHIITKLVHLVGFIARNFSRCTVTWTSKFLTSFFWVHFDDYFNKLIPTRTRQHIITKLVHLVCFIARNLSRFTVTWTSESLTFFSWVHFDDCFNKLVPTRTQQTGTH